MQGVQKWMNEMQVFWVEMQIGFQIKLWQLSCLIRGIKHFATNFCSPILTSYKNNKSCASSNNIK